MLEDTKTIQIQEFKLESDCELRFEVESKNEKVVLTLKSGFAEVFGTELVKGKMYEFTAGAKVAVFSWQGCTLELKGKTDVSYIAKETPMVMYLNSHAALEQLRETAETENKRGPVVMVVGPCDVGKSTVCRLLLNYAVRVGRRPILVDLDVGQGQIAVPGTIGALLIERPATIEDGFSQEAPLVFTFGNKAPGVNSALYDMLVNKLAEKVNERLEVDKKTKVSGVVINTCGWVKAAGYRHILNVSKAFEVDVILVLDQERLFNELVRDMPSNVRVVFLPKSGGVVERNQSARAEARDHRIKEYFYGSKIPLYPHSFDVKWNEIKIFKIGAPALPDSCMPLGMKAEDHLTKLVLMQPGPGILHHLLAISFAENPDDEVITTNIAGFVCVTNVDVERQTITILAPQPRPLPNHLLLLMDLQFMDTH